MKKISLALVLISSILSAQQDLKKNYSPLKSTGELPAVFTQNIRTVIDKDITALKTSKENDKGLKYSFLTASNYEIERIVRSGNTLINDEVTVFLNKITDVLLKDNPGLRKQLNIFTLKSSVVNAYSYDKGYIFIDIGLIAQAESEAQLAYIICHEISHYLKHHNIDRYIKNEEIDRLNYEGQSNEDKLVEKCQYSKENESEADMEGFRLFERSLYNLKQAEKSFDMLQYAHLPFELIEFKKSFFESENYVIPKRYFLPQVSPIRDNSHEDDTKHTHPNTSKRKQAIKEIAANRDNTGRVLSVLGQTKFEYVRDLARMEICRLYMINRDYPNALYAAYILLEKYPNNQYLFEVVSKCMYAISLYGKGEISYNQDSYLKNGINSYSEYESYPQQIYHLINKMPENEWTIMSLNYVYRAHKKFPQNKVLSTYSDSLFRLMQRTNWGVDNFAKTYKKTRLEIKKDSVEVPKEKGSKTDLIANLQKEQITAANDTVYYYEVYTDLFMNDPEFKEKFPLSSITENTGEGFKSYDIYVSKKVHTVKKNIKTEIKINKVLLFEPFYMKINETKREEVQYLLSDKKQEEYSALIAKCSDKLALELVSIDPGILNAKDVDKINDYSVINDWFEEKFDTDDEKKAILNTNDIDQLIAKYGTRYVLKTGIASVVNKGGNKRTYFYGFLFDIKNNELIYKKYEEFRTSDRRDLVNANTYQMLFELKHPIKK